MRKARKPTLLHGGPWANRWVKLGTDATTLPFTLNGMSGRYVKGTWEPKE